MSTMEFGPAGHGEIRAIAELWTHAFPGGRTLAQRMQDLEDGGAYGGIDVAFVAHEGTELVGALKMYAMHTYTGGAVLPMMGLAAVAIAPTARRRGYGSQMCRQALTLARERGDVLGALYPFRPDFYRSLGWGTVGQLHSYMFPPETLLAATEKLAVRLARPVDEPGVMTCYDRVAHRSNGLIRRPERAWRQHLDAPGTSVFLCGRGSVAGYLCVRYGRSRVADRRPLIVQELIAESDEAYESLLAWLSRQRELWRRIRYDALPEEQFAHRLADPRAPGFRPARRLWSPVCRVIRGPMLRVLDVGRALAERQTWGTAPAFALNLQVRDPELPANEQPLTLRHEDGSVRVEMGRLTRATTLRTDAPTFAQIYAGELSVTAAERLGFATVEGDAGCADALFANGQTFRVLDEF